VNEKKRIEILENIIYFYGFPAEISKEAKSEPGYLNPIKLPEVQNFKEFEDKTITGIIRKMLEDSREQREKRNKENFNNKIREESRKRAIEESTNNKKIK